MGTFCLLKWHKDQGKRFSSLRAVSFLPIPEGNGSPERTSYGLKDRRNDEVFYVGMSTDPHSRYGEHLSLRGKAKVSAKGIRILDMRKEGIIPELVIFEHDIPAGKALDREKYWINYHLDIGSPLTNVAIPRKTAHEEVNDAISEEVNDAIPVASYTIGEVADLFQRSERSIYRLIVNGKINAFKVGTSWRFEKEYIDSIATQEREEPIPRAEIHIPEAKVTTQEYDPVEWYTPAEALKKLSENSNKQIDDSYLRTLVKIGKIERFKMGSRFSLYKKSDIDSYVIAGRGEKWSKNNKKTGERKINA